MEEDPDPPSPGRFFNQQKELKLAYNKMQELTAEKISIIIHNQGIISDEQIARDCVELDQQIEFLHLSITNYFGDCDKRKQKIEAKIGNNLDISGFSHLGQKLASL